MGWQLIDDAESTAAIRTLIDDVTTLAPSVANRHDADAAWVLQTESLDGPRADD